MMRVDRIEENIVVLECDDGRMAEIPLYLLPDGVHEGSVIKLTDGRYIIDREAENKIKTENASRTKALFKRR